MIHCVSTQNASQVTQGTIAITKQSKAGRPPTFLSAQKSMLTPEELAGDAGKSSITDGRVGRLWLALTSVVNGNGCSGTSGRGTAPAQLLFPESSAESRLLQRWAEFVGSMTVSDLNLQMIVRRTATISSLPNGPVTGPRHLAFGSGA